jgi:N-acetylneuraminic acid mutarotase
MCALLANCNGGGSQHGDTFTISGTVTGLNGTGLVLTDNGGDNLSVTANGSFTFATAVARGGTYAVTVATQPSNPAQACTVANGSGTVVGNVASVQVTCTNTATTYTIGGTVAGLTGSGLVLEDNGGDNLSVAAGATTFTFATKIASGSAYVVTVKTQPSSPAQTCTVASGSGTATANVTNVAVTCTTTSYTIGGTLSGLSGTGLVLQDNGGDNLSVAANGSFTFATKVASGGAYAVTVKTQPSSPAQACTVASGTGTATANVTNVAVTCTTTSYTVGGTVSGLAGTGLVLQDNGGDNLAVTANGSFTFPTKVASGGAYAVTVKTQPSSPTQTCAVTNGTGTANANVTNVTVACTTSTTTYTIGGTVSGLSGTGLVLQDNGGDNLTVTANGSFTFATKVASGGAYAVTVKTQPSSPAQTCGVTNASGTATANVTNVTVACTTNTYTVGGTVSGLSGTGLVLQDNGGDNLAVTANGAFTFPTKVASGATYAVTVHTQPSSPAQTCTVTSGAGTVTNANVTNVSVACTTTTTTYAIGGTVTGLSGSGLVLQDNGGDNFSVTGNGAFTFATKIASGSKYAVTVKTQPSSPAQTCTVANGSGTATANVTNVTVTCTAATFSIGGTVSGLAGSGLVLQDNGVDNLAVTANGSFTFATKIASGSTYFVAVHTDPSSPAQTCAVTNDTGTVTNANVTNITVTCTTTGAFTIGGAISGLSAGGLVLQDNGGDNLSVASGATSFTFATKLTSGASYNVTVFSQPTGLQCTVSNGTGTAAGSVTNISVICGLPKYTLGGTITGLTAINLDLTDVTDVVAPAEGATSFTFPTPVQPGTAYTVSVRSQPTGLSCTVANGSGTMPSASVTNVAVSCTPVVGVNWVWEYGSSTGSVNASYGTMGVAAASNAPGARVSGVTWTDKNGNLWMWGGYGSDSQFSQINLNDLWEYSPMTSEWVWVNGSNIGGEAGVYGTQGTAAATNVPGAREGAMSFTDKSGNFWLFGGDQNISSTGDADFNDLWKYDVTTGEWTWESGSNKLGSAGNYGTQGVAAASNVPPARDSAVTWTDSSGNFWLFGGNSSNGPLNDLWEYSPSTGLWTWVAGSNGGGDLAGVYGTLGTPSPSNAPGARYWATSWADSKGNLWLFGGVGRASGSGNGHLNDLWRFNTSSGEWTWMAGSNTAEAAGVYGTMGTPAPTNTPGARYWTANWADSSDNLWFFGGSCGLNCPGGVSGYFSDLWKYSTASGQWTWMSGPQTLNADANYGTKGVAAATNIPGARQSPMSWHNAGSGPLWMFGGYGYVSTQNGQYLNDVWEYVP